MEPTADGLTNEDDAAHGQKRGRHTSEKIKPIAPYDVDSMRAAGKCIDRQTGRRVSAGDLETYRGALAQYHLYPESKFLNGRRSDRGLTARRHVKVSIGDIHYIGKEANELEEQVFLGFDPEAQPDYGMESGAYSELRTTVQDAVSNYKLAAISDATGISVRYLQKIRGNVANVTLATLRKIERALPEIGASQSEKLTLEQRWRDWARTECARIGLRPFAERLGVDHSNLAKIIAGERPIPRRLMIRFMKLHR
jgi:transcriptional regulator with XRE-family HTH domain